jgi:hypothetical protein
MLITAEELKYTLDSRGIPITGVLHLGAHECEEMGLYQSLGISSSDIVWIDGM